MNKLLALTLLGFVLIALTGQCHETNLFLKGPKNQSSTFWLSAEGFHNFWPSCYEESLMHTSMIWRTNCENPSSNPLQGACFGFPEAACDSISCSESRLWFWKLFRKPAMMYIGEIQPMRVRERRNRNLMRLTEQSLELVFQRKQEETLHLFFCLTHQAKSLKTICSCSKSTDLIGPQKISIWWANPYPGEWSKVKKTFTYCNREAEQKLNFYLISCLNNPDMYYKIGLEHYSVYW